MDFWSRVKKVTGQCAANTELDDLKAIVQTANGRIDKVLLGGKLVQSDSRIFEKLGKANEALGKVGEALNIAQDICLDLGAVGRIHDAVKILNADNGNVIYNDSEKAAQAFGDLFVGFGRLCRHLPTVGKDVGQFLEGAGDFFVNMNRKINPGLRWKNKWNEINKGASESGYRF